MKKLLVLFLLLIIPISIKAEDFHLEFRSDYIYSNNQFNLFYKDGYIFIDSNNGFNGNAPESLLNYYDHKGNLLKTNEISEHSILAAATDDEYVYAITYGNEEGGSRYSIIKIDKNLNIVAKLDEADLEVYIAGVGTYMDSNRILIKNGRIEFIYDVPLNDTQYLIDVDKNLANPHIVIAEESEDYNDFYFLPDNGEAERNFYKYNDSYYFTNSYINCEDIQGGDECAELVKYNSDSSLAWEKKYKQYERINQVEINSKNIFMVGAKANGQTELVKLDLEGNILTVYNAEATTAIVVNEDYLVAVTGEIRVCSLSFTTEEGGFCKSKIKHSVYRLYYDIEHEVAGGKGTVEVPLNSVKGERVTIKVTPEVGYVLKAIKVFDMEGNEIEVINNTFIMPESDVRVEAIFEEDKNAQEVNPDTKDITITTIILVTLATAGMYLIYRKKMKEMN